MLGERFTAVPGSSDYFAGGFITYTNAMKVELLGVPVETLQEHGPVSKETAEAMAIGARRRCGATYAISITGVAGPDSGGEPVPAGTVYVAISDAAGTHVATRQFLSDRQRGGWAEEANSFLKRTPAPGVTLHQPGGLESSRL
jgi:PncC family amidohydrolase